jgi:nucleoside phosphorylase/DNA-binding NarL/FixJ family response regulator
MIEVLVVEDDERKLSAIREVLTALPRGNVASCQVARDIVSAKSLLATTAFDVLLLDLVVPMRSGEIPARDGGARLLRELLSNYSLKRPKFVVGITAYREIGAQQRDLFAAHLFGLIIYDNAGSRWRSSLRNVMGHAIAARDAAASGEEGPPTDMAIVCALDSPELSSVLALPMEWEAQDIQADSTLYYKGTLNVSGRTKHVVAVSCPQMGMVNAASIAMKAICKFSPRVIATVGIAGGFKRRVSLGEVVVADPTWDYGSGKVIELAKKQRGFQQAPLQVRLDPLIRAQLMQAITQKFLTERWASFKGKKPAAATSMQVGPMACGASVIANASVGKEIESQHRKVIALDMESYGVCTAAELAPYPRPLPIVIKAIVDFGDKRKGVIDVREYSAYMAAEVLYMWAQSYLGSSEDGLHVTPLASSGL